jgi:hypothetical protein
MLVYYLLTKLPKVAGFAHQIHNKDGLYQTFKNMRHTCKDAISSKKEVPTKRVTTRWNSDLACAETHRDLRAPIEMMTASSNYKLTRYQLLPRQWDWLSVLCDCLPVSIPNISPNCIQAERIYFQIFEAPTLFFSQTQTPLIHEALPWMMTLKIQLEVMRDDPDNEVPPIIRLAAHSALHVHKKYMRLMEEADIYWIAIGALFSYSLSKTPNLTGGTSTVSLVQTSVVCRQ